VSGSHVNLLGVARYKILRNGQTHSMPHVIEGHYTR